MKAPGRARASRALTDRAIVTVVAFALRFALAPLAASFPPAGDGTFYDVIARRIAAGHGYTWLWPDGAVTYAAHYPVGFPALLGGAYAVLGVHPWVVVLVNALLGAAGAAAAHRLAWSVTTPRRALVGGLLVAAHPALVPYALATMTEGATTALVLVAAGLAESARAREAPRARAALALASFVAIGVATLVRPQCLVLAPVLGALVWQGRLRASLAGAAAAALVAVLVCAPWTARNCVRMKQCALVSVNGGWNLLIGAQSDTGSWTPVDVPEPCKTVWDEAGKDACFGVAARRVIGERPGAWIAKAPAKLATTLDYFGAAPWYLNASNGSAFGDRAKVALGTVETLASRALLLAAALAAGWTALRRPLGAGMSRAELAGRLVALGGAPFALLRHAWPGYVLLAIGLAVLALADRRPRPVLGAFSAAVVLATCILHAIFFGAGRYGLVVAPFVALLAAAGLPRPEAGAIVGASTPTRRSLARSSGTAGSDGREESPSSEEHDAG